MSEYDAPELPNNPRLSKVARRYTSRYTAKEWDAKKTLEKLKSLDRPGAHFAGEVCLQEAKRDPDQAASWYERSMRYHGKMGKACIINPKLDHVSLYAKSQVRLAQSPITRSLYVDHAMPDAGIVQGAYYETLDKASDLGTLLAFPQKKLNVEQLRERQDVVGLLGELSVLLLGQRYALKSGATANWLPSRSLYEDDQHRRVSDRSYRNNWDLDVWSANNRNGGVKCVDKIQVKNALFQGDGQRGPEMPYAPNITVINVNPDLQTDHPVYSLTRTIVYECWAETQQVDEHTDQAISSLDARTEKLLSAFSSLDSYMS